MSKPKSKYYVVWIGQKPGIYNSWDKCKAQIIAFPGAKYKSFKTQSEAIQAFSESPNVHLNNKTSSKSKKANAYSKNIDMNSISVDAACSQNPGIMEYQGVVTSTKEQLFHMGPYYDGTNNVGEFLALVQALAYLKKLDKEHIKIYSDSRTAMAWVRNKKVKTTLKKTAKNEILFDLMNRAVDWLSKNNYKTQILKWETKKWGEIPADFGRK